jgi:hypothetical protein
VNVLRDTYRALVSGGDLLDFHPTYPPWARVEVNGVRLGELKTPSWPEQLRTAEAGMRQVVERGLFRLVAERTHELREHYDDADDLIDIWQEEIGPDLERRVRTAHGSLHVVEKVVFRLYRTV